MVRHPTGGHRLGFSRVSWASNRARFLPGKNLKTCAPNEACCFWAVAVVKSYEDRSLRELVEAGKITTCELAARRLKELMLDKQNGVALPCCGPHKISQVCPLLVLEIVTLCLCLCAPERNTSFRTVVANPAGLLISITRYAHLWKSNIGTGESRLEQASIISSPCTARLSAT